MVFKLVRVDTEDPFKIQLPLGTHLLGRGKFLDCDDKRVSRQHGKLEVTGDTITVQALHMNPCFYSKKGTEETQILKQNCTVNLSHGDKFGLLPNSYWYELLHCSDLDVGRSPERISEESTQPLEYQPVPKTVPDENGIDNTADNEEIMNCDANETVAESGSESQSLIPASLTPRETSPARQAVALPSSPPTVTDDRSTAQVDPQVQLDSDATNQGSPSPPKRCHSSEDSKDEVKKIKAEPDDPDVKQEPEDRPGPSGDQGPSSNNVPGMPPSPAKVAPLGRERCIYGASCYRRNPQHKAQFAHPSDADWGAGSRGVCPYGGRCRRRDPRHWSTHDHPPGVAPPPPNAPAQRRTKRERSSSEEDDNSEDDTSQNLIVTGKRTRKTIKRPSYSGSEFEDDEKDPYATDEEDEWVPGSQSQYTQDTQDD